MSNDKGRIMPDSIKPNDLEDNFEHLISCLKSNLYRIKPRLTIFSIQIALGIGYMAAKRIYLKLKEEGYLNDSGQLVWNEVDNTNKKSFGLFSKENPDYIKYVRSRDIREYLYEINYELSELEAFYIVDSCTHITFDKKLKLLEQLHSDGKDTELNIINYRDIRSLKSLLQSVIAGRMKSLSEFKISLEHQAIFKVCHRAKSYPRKNSYLYIEDGYYQELDAALSAVKAEDYDYIRVEKIKLGTLPPHSEPVLATAYFNKNRELLEIDDNSNYYPSYQDVCINIPVPFYKGDILIFTDNFRDEDKSYNFIYDSCSFQEKNIKSGSDFSDNTLLIYKIALGYPFLDTSFNMFDYEYSRNYLQDDELKLKPFSLFLKGVCKIDETLKWMNHLDDKIKKNRLKGLVEQYIPEVLEATAVNPKR